ncbi:MAG TPA: hypothetical protein VND64_26795 [Pirellulales bacterium]|nr:hypothetical protein [Pirellulales bacterium]
MSERSRGTTEDLVELGEISDRNRWNPGYFEDHFVEVERRLNELRAVPLGTYIPDLHLDGSKGITYGQVGARELDPEGEVRYLQVVNIRDTGIDFAIKPDRVADGSHNDPPRSRVCKGDMLFTNNAFRDTNTLLGRCVVVVADYGKLNISQHIDRVRVLGINPYYVCTFLKSRFGQRQIVRVIHGVDSTSISFGRIRATLIPEAPGPLQQEVERQYTEMSENHERAMRIKERLLDETGADPGYNGEEINALAEEKPAYKRALREAKERLDHLMAELEAVIEGRRDTLRPFPE